MAVFLSSDNSKIWQVQITYNSIGPHASFFQVETRSFTYAFLARWTNMKKKENEGSKRRSVKTHFPEK